MDVRRNKIETNLINFIANPFRRHAVTILRKSRLLAGHENLLYYEWRFLERKKINKSSLKNKQNLAPDFYKFWPKSRCFEKEFGQRLNEISENSETSSELS